MTLFVKPILLMCELGRTRGRNSGGAQITDEDTCGSVGVLGAAPVEELLDHFGGIEHDGRLMEELEIDDVTCMRAVSARGMGM